MSDTKGPDGYRERMWATLASMTSLVTEPFRRALMEPPAVDCPVCGAKITVHDRVPCDLHEGGPKRCPVWE